MSSPDSEKKAESVAHLHSPSRARDGGSRPDPSSAVLDVRKIAGNQGLAALIAQRRAAAEIPSRTAVEAGAPSTAMQADVAVSRLGEGDRPSTAEREPAGQSLAERRAQIAERTKALEERKRTKAKKALSERRAQQAERRTALEERKAARRAEGAVKKAQGAVKKAGGPVLEARPREQPAAPAAASLQERLNGLWSTPTFRAAYKKIEDLYYSPTRPTVVIPGRTKQALRAESIELSTEADRIGRDLYERRITEQDAEKREAAWRSRVADFDKKVADAFAKAKPAPAPKYISIGSDEYSAWMSTHGYTGRDRT